MNSIRIKRVYDTPAEGDGCRILVDRLWPRGLTKEQVHADLWLKEIAPGNELRKAFHHGQMPWEEFVTKYTAELDANPEAVQRMLMIINETNGTVTLLYSAREAESNQAVVLKEYLLALQARVVPEKTTVI